MFRRVSSLYPILSSGILAGACAVGAFAAAAPARAATYAIVYSFKGGSTDGAYPMAGLLDVGGILYGTTFGGGASSMGTAFKVTTAGIEGVLHSFGATNDGAQPLAGLTHIGGTFYGTTNAGGTSGYGTVYSLTKTGTEKVLHSFTGVMDGQNPQAPLLNVGGTLYGTTNLGGITGADGTVFSITTGGMVTILHSFNLTPELDGGNPTAGLIDVGGTLYGTTSNGGLVPSHGFAYGTVFAMSLVGAETILHTFSAVPPFTAGPAYFPASGLTSMGGKFYGTTQCGGSSGYGCNGYGTVFSVTTAGVEKVVYSFQGGSDGSMPLAGVTKVGTILYGVTTQGGGANNFGAIYSVTTKGVETVLHGFAETPDQDGYDPVGPLINVGGVLYGTTRNGGAHGYGTVFSLTP